MLNDTGTILTAKLQAHIECLVVFHRCSGAKSTLQTHTAAVTFAHSEPILVQNHITHLLYVYLGLERQR